MRPKKQISKTPDPYIIRKYSNRKLYDVQTGKYIKNLDIIRLYHSGLNLEVQDSSASKNTLRGALEAFIADTVYDLVKTWDIEDLGRLTRCFEGHCPSRWNLNKKSTRPIPEKELKNYSIQELRQILNLPPIEAKKKRNCLKCSESFISEAKGVRLCQKCKETTYSTEHPMLYEIPKEQASQES